MADINKTRAEVAQIVSSVGSASSLTTQNKSSLVAAINEVVSDITTMESHMQVVDSLPASPDANTFYFIRESS